MTLTTKWVAGTATVIVIAAAIGLRISFRSSIKRNAENAAMEQKRIQRFQLACKDSIEQFHQRFNAGQVEQIYDNSGSGPQERDRELWRIQQARNYFGQFRRTKNTEITCFSEPSSMCEATYVSEFEKGEGTEVFSLHSEEDRITVSLDLLRVNGTEVLRK